MSIKSELKNLSLNTKFDILRKNDFIVNSIKNDLIKSIDIKKDLLSLLNKAKYEYDLEYGGLNNLLLRQTEKQITQKLSKIKKIDNHSWTEKHPARWNSSIRYIKDLTKEMKNVNTFVDIGSGLGVVCLALAILYPKTKFIGYEIVEKKIDIANKAKKRLNLSNVEFIKQDLGNETFVLPKAELYYMYAPVNSNVARKLVDDFYRKQHSYKIISCYSFCEGNYPALLQASFTPTENKSLRIYTKK